MDNISRTIVRLNNENRVRNIIFKYDRVGNSIDVLNQ